MMINILRAARLIGACPADRLFAIMKAAFLAILAGLFWGVGELFTKQVLRTQTIGPLTAITVRTTIAMPVLWAVYVVFVQMKKTEPHDWLGRVDGATLLKLIVGPGLFAGSIGMILFYGALHHGPISKVKPIAVTVAPVVAVILGWLVLGESMSIRKVIAVLLIVGGVVLLTSEPHGSAHDAAPASMSIHSPVRTPPSHPHKKYKATVSSSSLIAEIAAIITGRPAA